jgi:Leucine-rich repeat (LRR) protein
LRANQLTSLPAGIGTLPKLEKLDLRWNKLSSMPGWLRELERGGCLVYL